MHVHLVLGNQLFEPEILDTHLHGIQKDKIIVFMREDIELCTYYKFHKQKIYLFLAAMRHYAEELREAGYTVDYHKLTTGRNESSGREKKYEDALAAFIEEHSVTSFSCFEIEDKFFEARIFEAISKAKVTRRVLQSPMFLTSRDQFAEYLSRSRRPYMKTFYEWQRKRLKILLDTDEKPVGGQWSFDSDNRKQLPKNIYPPELPEFTTTPIAKNVQQLCNEIFVNHPGELTQLWLPVTRSDAKKWFDHFLKERFTFFGPYEDAMPAHSDFVFHSVLTPALNMGLLIPKEIISEALDYARKHPKQVSMPSLEGFIRQVIGWREFVRGIYRNYSEQQDEANFFHHRRQLSEVWYGGKLSGIPPLDRAIGKVVRFGYTHHIERLMVFGSLMVLLEVAPKNAHKWFMEMFVDSSDWVMGPNVYGMALFADGGIFATKPYICGSNYYRKMGGDRADAWCDGVDGLYWSFIEKHLDFFSKNPRLSVISRSVTKIAPARKAKIYAAADRLRELLTVV